MDDKKKFKLNATQLTAILSSALFLGALVLLFALALPEISKRQSLEKDIEAEEKALSDNETARDKIQAEVDSLSAQSTDKNKSAAPANYANEEAVFICDVLEPMTITYNLTPSDGVIKLPGSSQYVARSFQVTMTVMSIDVLHAALTRIGGFKYRTVMMSLYMNANPDGTLSAEMEVVFFEKSR